MFTEPKIAVSTGTFVKSDITSKLTSFLLRKFNHLILSTKSEEFFRCESGIVPTNTEREEESHFANLHVTLLMFDIMGLSGALSLRSLVSP